MKFTTTLVTLVALVATSSVAEAALTAGCDKYIKELNAATNPLSKCRVYTTLGFPNLTRANDHDTPKLATALDTYCAQPACTDAQYKQAIDGFSTNCAADITAASEDVLSADHYMWYLSPPQQKSVCVKNPATSKYCVIESMDSMIARKQIPNGNPQMDDLYGYLQYVTPLLSNVNMSNADFCTPCNQYIANIFATYFKKTPSTFPLNFGQKLNSTTLLGDLEYQYKTACKIDITAPQDLKTPAGNNKGGNSTTDDKAPSAAVGLTAANTLSGVVAVVAGVAGLMNYL
ncbi:hypothetical protein DFQ27_006946 [Actinomortierella ambigua]|uniref:Secreted protein n=1 Tax=Actinomortierella ambigua TaxID=1343610 RepID=A0A9P6PUE9_9FUNG|nr:hypothetical protein DFQ26_007235 [Actinomortierella ambigua]KAG0254260.1 hypothetical protein DFQ27_006946 [Actinomortierella ambigua]